MAQQFCKACGTALIPGKEFCPNCLVRGSGVIPAAPKEKVKKQYPKDTPENRARKLKEYKVISFEEAITNARFSKKSIENELNSHASDGWKVKECSISNPSSLAFTVNQLIIILERDMPLEP
jgi:uncharacterized Zn finger protein (UPF0148 family)